MTESSPTPKPVHDVIDVFDGPQPEFHAVSPDGWQFALAESPTIQIPSITRIRTNNAKELSNRCHAAWESGGTMTLVYRNDFGIEQAASIMAIRPIETQEDDFVVVWVYIDPEDYAHLRETP